MDNDKLGLKCIELFGPEKGMGLYSKILNEGLNNPRFMDWLKSINDDINMSISDTIYHLISMSDNPGAMSVSLSTFIQPGITSPVDGGGMPMPA